MRRIRKKMSTWTAKFLDVPQDVTLDLPRLTLIGNRQLYIENHRGVLHFSDNYLKLALSKGHLEIQGKGLTIRAILTEEVMVEGAISDLKYIDTK